MYVKFSTLTSDGKTSMKVVAFNTIIVIKIIVSGRSSDGINICLASAKL